VGWVGQETIEQELERGRRAAAVADITVGFMEFLLMIDRMQQGRSSSAAQATREWPSRRGVDA